VNSLKHEKPVKECFDIQARGPKSARPRAFTRFAQWLIRPSWQGGTLESLSSLTGQQIKKSAGRLGSPGLPDCFFDAKFHKRNFFLETLSVKKLFGFFSLIFGFLGGSWHMLTDWCLGF